MKSVFLYLLKMPVTGTERCKNIFDVKKFQDKYYVGTEF